MKGILIKGSPQATEVVVLTDTIQLEVLAIEPEARLRIKPECTEACGGLVGIHHLTAH